MTDPRTGVRRPVSVDELRRAWRAIDAGQFRVVARAADHSQVVAPESPDIWMPASGEGVVAVIGCAGSVGASTLALAMGSAWLGSARVVECCPPSTSGLAAATTVELGRHPSGWLLGKRDQVLVDRVGHASDPRQLLPRGDAHTDLTLLDVGSNPGGVLAGSGWLQHSIRMADLVVLVGVATIPGLRRVAAAIDMLSDTVAPARLTAAVRGPRRSKWARGVEAAGGRPVVGLLSSGRLVEFPSDPVLAVAGCDSRPLPGPLLAAARRVLAMADPLTFAATSDP